MTPSGSASRPGAAPAASAAASRPRSSRRIAWQPLLLLVLALLDLRTELLLLLDHFTWTSLSIIPAQHPLAMAVLLLWPSLLRRYR